MASLKHVHKYYQRENKLWYCGSDEGCSHYCPGNTAPPVGQKSHCWSCDEIFKLTPVNMMNTRPMCDTCSERLELIESLTNKKLSGIIPNNPYAVLDSRPAIDKLKTRVELRESEKDEVEIIEPSSDEPKSTKQKLTPGIIAELLELYGPDWIQIQELRDQYDIE